MAGTLLRRTIIDGEPNLRRCGAKAVRFAAAVK